MDINPELQQAVRERIQSGHHRSAILQELREAGYSIAEAEAVYSAVASERGVVSNHETPTQTPPAANSTTTEYYPAGTTEPTSFFSKHPWLSVGGIVLLLSVGGAVAVSAWFDVSGWRNYVPFFNSPPYDEVTLIPGIMNDLSNTTTATGDSYFKLAWEPRTNEATEALPELFEAIEMMGGFIGLPEEASIETTAKSQIDARNKQDIRSNIQMSLAVDYDIMQLNMQGSVRQADGVVYGRIEDFPTTFQEALGSVPMNTWITLFDQATLEELESGTVPFPMMPGIPFSQLLDNPVLAELVPAEWLAALESETGVMSVPVESQLGLVAETAPNIPPSPLNDTDAVTEVLDEKTQQAIIDAIATAWITAPVTTFAREPERIRVDGESVYQYDLVINADNLATFVATLRTELVEYPELQRDLPTVADLPDAQDIALFNKLVTMLVTVRPDGSLHGIQISSVITSPNPQIANQINMVLTARYAELPEGVTIEKPAAVHPKSLLEIIEQEQRAAAQGNVEAAIGSFRVTAEIYYNENDFSYAGLCEAEAETASLWLDEVDCLDKADAYVVKAPFNETEEFCIDSTGFSGAIFRLTDEVSTPSYTCVTE